MKKSRFIRSLGIGTSIVAVLTVLLYLTESYVIVAWLVAGLMASLPITGYHGGTETQEFIGAVVAFLINTSIYSCVACLALSLHDRGKE